MRALENPHPLEKHPRRIWHILALLASFLDFQTRGSERIAVGCRAIEFRNLPRSFHGYRILHLSDLHLRGRSGKEERLLAILEATPADLVVMTGDFSFRFGEQEDRAVDFIREAAAVLKRGCAMLGVRGNSDHPHLMERLEEAGIKILNNEGLRVARRAESIFIGGVDDAHHHRDDAGRAFSGVPPDDFKILLSHSPDIVLKLRNIRIDLILAGHTHGGQVNFPLIGPLVTKTRVGRKFASGVIWTGDTCVHVSRGIGGSGPRFRCSPEVSLIELKQKRSLEHACHNPST